MYVRVSRYHRFTSAGEFSAVRPAYCVIRHTAAVLSSLVATAKRHHIDPFAYLRQVLARISAHPQHRLEELLPDKWKAAQARG